VYLTTKTVTADYVSEHGITIKYLPTAIVALRLADWGMREGIYPHLSQPLSDFEKSLNAKS
jgi:hypothetical protein